MHRLPHSHPYIAQYYRYCHHYYLEYGFGEKLSFQWLDYVIWPQCLTNLAVGLHIVYVAAKDVFPGRHFVAVLVSMPTSTVSHNRLQLPPGRGRSVFLISVNRARRL